MQGVTRAVAGVSMLAMIVALAVSAHAQRTEDQAVTSTLAIFYDGWNAHDPEKMVSIFAEDVDHINVYGEWHKGKAALRQDLALIHAGPSASSQRQPTFEKIRFLGQTVAVVQVSSQQVGAGNTTGPTLGTYVLEKRGERWVAVSFTNVAPNKPPYAK